MIEMGSSDSSGSSSSASGFRDLPEEIQNAFKSLATEAGNYIGTDELTNMFTVSDLSDAEQAAVDAVNAGFTPTAESISSDIEMQWNPYNEYVIDEINRQATGDNSALNSALSTAGQFGSNRMALGANDIDLSRTNQIGSFLQSEYNTALNNAITTLPESRSSDAQSQLGVGSFLRELESEQNQAPVTALAAISQILGVLPTNSSTSSGDSSSSSWNFGFSA